MNDALRQAYDAERSRLDGLVRQQRAALREHDARNSATAAPAAAGAEGASNLSDACLLPPMPTTGSSETCGNNACPASVSGTRSDDGVDGGNVTVVGAGAHGCRSTAATTVEARLLLLERQKLEADRALEAVHRRMASRTQAAAAAIAREPTPAEFALGRQQRDEGDRGGGGGGGGSVKPQLASPGMRWGGSFTRLGGGGGSSGGAAGRMASLQTLGSPQASAGGDFRGSSRSITSALK